MFQKIKNNLLVNVEGADLTKAKKIVFFIRQERLHLKYTPLVVNAGAMIVEIPKADADRLRHDIPAELQFAYTDENGNDIPVEKVIVDVEEFINPEGYDGGSKDARK